MDKEREYVNDVEIEVSSISLQAGKNPAEIEKVIFETEKGNITYKPKIDKEERVDGFKIASKAAPCVDDLPKNLKELNVELNKAGTIKVKATYQVWNTEMDGTPVTYRYVMGAKMFEKWQLVKSKQPKEELVL